jgi:hypothetical protein
MLFDLESRPPSSGYARLGKPSFIHSKATAAGVAGGKPNSDVSANESGAAGHEYPHDRS